MWSNLTVGVFIVTKCLTEQPTSTFAEQPAVRKPGGTVFLLSFKRLLKLKELLVYYCHFTLLGNRFIKATAHTVAIIPAYSDSDIALTVSSEIFPCDWIKVV